MPPESNNMSDPDLVEGVVDADARIVYDDGTEENIPFMEVMDYVNDPLDRDLIEDYVVSGRKTAGSMGNQKSEVDRTADIAEMATDYYQHIENFDVEVDLHYDTNGDGEPEKTRTLVGDPRTDVDMKTGVFPSILPLQFQDSEQYLVLREMQTYERDFLKHIAKEAEFTGRNGGAFDWQLTDSIMDGEYDHEQEPNTFAYVPEPVDFLAINGEEGYHQQAEENENLPYISVPDWAILDMDENKGSIVGVRPFYDNVWEAGVSTGEAEKIGRWRGVNRALGRVMHDMDDEFFHGFNGDGHFVGFYDNEFPHAVSTEKVFDGDEWKRHKDNFREQAEGAEEWIQHLINVMRDEELETAEEVKEEGVDRYTELIDTKLDPGRVPDEMRAHKIF
jgi:hypothetical protein